jgi:hypothetical protein
MTDPRPTAAATREAPLPEGDGRTLVRERLQAFQDRITQGAASAERRIDELPTHGLAQFVLADLLPNRVLAAGVFPAAVTPSDADHLSLYLDDIELAVLGQLVAAPDADAVADVVLQAAEDLHSYLLGYDLVDARYRHLTAGSLFRRGDNRPNANSLASWQAHPVSAEEDVATCTGAEDSHEYALAA